MTVDEELNQLDDNLRRLKIEYDIFFGGGSKRPPTDLDWRVQSAFKRHGDSNRLSFSQRFKYNSLQQKYAIYSDLWRKKARIREEGYRRPQDALLSVQGVRPTEQHEPQHHPVYGLSHAAATAAAPAPGAGDQPLTVHCSDPATERDQVERLYHALTAAKKKAGERVTGNLDTFASFVQNKTAQIRKQHGCEAVEFTVEMQNGKVKLKAKAGA